MLIELENEREGIGIYIFQAKYKPAPVKIYLFNK